MMTTVVHATEVPTDHQPPLYSCEKFSFEDVEFCDRYSAHFGIKTVGAEGIA